MGIKDDLNKDLGVFFNTDELAEQHIIDGRPLNIIIDNDRLMQRSRKEFDVISIGEILYFVKKVDYGERPREGAPQVFDGRLMYVFSCREDGGIYEIILQQNRSE
ncbi:MAG: hypothetical protein QHH10_08245 [Peptococcaceae bacterium]|jgi:hypothetical protein|nr:hypothetical protein [Peptococcaceae bacterium]MDH7525284.1 hypothetical protein [Peptococcaceae bacterium]